MKQTVTFSAFVDAFRATGRFDDFGYSALRVLFDYFEEYEEASGEEIELDVIAICCDFTVDTWENIANEYDIDLTDCDDNDAKEQAVWDYLNNQTMVLNTCDEGIVYQSF